MLNRAVSRNTTNSAPPAPASSPPSTKVNITTRSMFTPMSWAVSGSCAVARMPRPSRLRLTNWSSPIISATAATKTSTLSVRHQRAIDLEERALLHQPLATRCWRARTSPRAAPTGTARCRWR